MKKMGMYIGITVMGIIAVLCTGCEVKKERTVHLDQLMAAIADYIDTLPPRTAYLFPSRKGDAILVRRKLTALLLMLAFKSVIIRLVLTQCARRSVILITTLMEIFNHSSQKTTLRYIGMTDERIKQSIKNVSFF